MSPAKAAGAPLSRDFFVLSPRSGGWASAAEVPAEGIAEAALRVLSCRPPACVCVLISSYKDNRQTGRGPTQRPSVYLRDLFIKGPFSTYNPEARGLTVHQENFRGSSSAPNLPYVDGPWTPDGLGEASVLQNITHPCHCQVPRSAAKSGLPCRWPPRCLGLR